MSGGLFGGLFGGGNNESNQAVGEIAEGSQPLTVEFTELAIGLIDESIVTPNAVWVTQSENPQTEENLPFVVDLPTTENHDVKILFTSDALEDRQFRKYLKDTALSDGMINGYMYPYAEFTPKLKDTVRWRGQILTVRAIDPIQPIDHPVLYFLELAT